MRPEHPRFTPRKRHCFERLECLLRAPLWVISGHFAMSERCPLYSQSGHSAMQNKCAPHAPSYVTVAATGGDNDAGAVNCASTDVLCTNRASAGSKCQSRGCQAPPWAGTLRSNDTGNPNSPPRSPRTTERQRLSPAAKRRLKQQEQEQGRKLCNATSQLLTVLRSWQKAGGNRLASSIRSSFGDIVVL